jgi:hypothetical protein
MRLAVTRTTYNSHLMSKLREHDLTAVGPRDLSFHGSSNGPFFERQGLAKCSFRLLVCDWLLLAENSLLYRAETFRLLLENEQML